MELTFIVDLFQTFLKFELRAIERVIFRTQEQGFATFIKRFL
jgi:hypothetical protein